MKPEEPKTETTLTTRIKINIPGSRPIPPVVMRTPVADQGDDEGPRWERRPPGATSRPRPLPSPPRAGAGAEEGAGEQGQRLVLAAQAEVQPGDGGGRSRGGRSRAGRQPGGPGGSPAAPAAARDRASTRPRDHRRVPGGVPGDHGPVPGGLPGDHRRVPGRGAGRRPGRPPVLHRPVGRGRIPEDTGAHGYGAGAPGYLAMGGPGGPGLTDPSQDPFATYGAGGPGGPGGPETGGGPGGFGTDTPPDGFPGLGGRPSGPTSGPASGDMTDFDGQPPTPPTGSPLSGSLGATTASGPLTGPGGPLGFGRESRPPLDEDVELFREPGAGPGVAAGAPTASPATPWSAGCRWSRPPTTGRARRSRRPAPRRRRAGIRARRRRAARPTPPRPALRRLGQEAREEGPFQARHARRRRGRRRRRRVRGRAGDEPRGRAQRHHRPRCGHRRHLQAVGGRQARHRARRAYARVAEGVRGRRAAHLKPSVAGLVLDTEATVRDVAGRDYNPVTVIGSLFGGTHKADPAVSVDEEKLRDALQRLAGDSGTAREGTIRFESGRAVAVHGKEGKGLDIDRAVTAVDEGFRERAATGENKVITLPVTTKKPKISDAEVDKKMKSFAEPAMSGLVTIQTDPAHQIPFGPDRSLPKILSMRVVNGELVPHYDLDAIKQLYGSTFDGVLITRGNGSQTPVTPQDVAVAMGKALLGATPPSASGSSRRTRADRRPSRPRHRGPAHRAGPRVSRRAGAVPVPYGPCRSNRPCAGTSPTRPTHDICHPGVTTDDTAARAPRRTMLVP
ncbi:hypothetical protein NKH77_34430 [Streptomyces sp. M19]